MGRVNSFNALVCEGKLNKVVTIYKKIGDTQKALTEVGALCMPRFIRHND